MRPKLPVDFTYETAIAYEPGVTRRDPSPVIDVDGRYHTWYSYATHDASGYYASLYHAVSENGHAWTETGEALPVGPDGAWDSNGVFTPTTLVADGVYHLFYTAVPKPFTNDEGGPGGTPTAIGVATADSPDGPWIRFEGNPVLRPGTGDEFDSHRVDDSCIIVRGGKYLMYYKGRQAGRTPGETKMGLAVADSPTGPYVKHADNPIFGSGHEVCVWPHGTGVAALISPTGPEGNTLQYSEDGISFERVRRIEAPRAPGPFRADGYRDGEGPGVTWGVSMDLRNDRPCLFRFDCVFE